MKDAGQQITPRNAICDSKLNTIGLEYAKGFDTWDLPP